MVLYVIQYVLTKMVDWVRLKLNLYQNQDANNYCLYGHHFQQSGQRNSNIYHDTKIHRASSYIQWV